MTNEETIGFLQSRVDLIDKYYPDVKDYREALVMAIEALEQEPCDDCIGREETMQIIRAWFDRDAKPSELTNEVEQMPPVTPQPKVGEWLKNGELCRCSNCHSNVLFSAIKLYNYCYHCGARMEVSE